MARLIPVASGKGGVGKTLIVANLGVALARKGQAVIAIDLDLGGSNLHTFLGVANKNPGLGALKWKQERNLKALLTATGEERLWLVPGDNLLPGVANIDWQTKKRIIKELASLPADAVLLDLGAGSSWNAVDFWLSGASGLLVVSPEITSVLNAYSFLKTAVYRLLSRSLPAAGPLRADFDAFAAAKTEGGGRTYLDFARELAERSPGEAGPALLALEALKPSVVVNRAQGQGDAEVGRRLRDIALRNLGLALAFAAFLPEDPAVPASLAARAPLVARDPSSPFSKALSAFAGRLAQLPAEVSPGPLGNLELEALAEGFDAVDA